MAWDDYISSGRLARDIEHRVAHRRPLEDHSSEREEVEAAAAALGGAVGREYLALYELAVAGTLPRLSGLLTHGFGPAERYDDGDYTAFDQQRELIEAALGVGGDGAGIELQLVQGGRVMEFDDSQLAFDGKSYPTLGECMWWLVHKTAVEEGTLAMDELTACAREAGASMPESVGLRRVRTKPKH